jgi:hypothetical protein
MGIDVEKLSAETRWRLMRFAEMYSKHPGLMKPDRTNENTFPEFLDVKRTLDSCPESEVHTLVDLMSLDKALQSCDNDGPDERDLAAAKMMEAELEAVKLGKRCAAYIENLK